MTEKPMFIPDEPTLDDQFGVHEKIAKRISEFITKLENGIPIALKGRWGSGKSSVIEMLKKMGKGKYKVFVFDVWAELGHDFRQAFLLKFLDWVKEEGVKLKRYEDKRDQILGKKKKVEREVLPKDERAVLYLFLLIVILILLPSVIGSVVSIISQSLSWRIAFDTMAFCVLPLTIAELFFYQTLRSLEKNPDEKDKNQKIIWFHYSLWIIYLTWIILALGDLILSRASKDSLLSKFYNSIYSNQIVNVLQGALILGYFVTLALTFYAVKNIYRDSKNSLSIISMYSGLLVGKYKDHETMTSLSSNSLDFEKEFEKILEEYFKNSNDEKLVIVIDNIDRIPMEKVDEVFSSLKPFMVSDKLSNKVSTNYSSNLKNVWYIIPFDPNGIRIGLDKGGYDYFNKLFKKEFYVPEPVYGSWQLFLEKMVKELIKNDLPTYILEVALQLSIGFKTYLENFKSSEKILDIDSQNKNDNDDERETEEEDTTSFGPDNRFIPPTPREVKKFLNNFITILPHSLLSNKPEEDQLFSYALFAALKTYGMMSDSEQIERIFMNKIEENHSIFEDYLVKKGYIAYGFIDGKKLTYSIYAIYHGISYEEAYIALNTPELEKILSEPFYNDKFSSIIRKITSTDKAIAKGAIKSAFNSISKRIYDKEPQLAIIAAAYLKELKKVLPEIYDEVKETVFAVLKNEPITDRKFVVDKIDRLFEIEKEGHVQKLLESIIFIWDEVKIDLLNPILKYSDNKGKALIELINGDFELDPRILKENPSDPEHDAKHISKVLEFIGEKFTKDSLKRKDNAVNVISKTLPISMEFVEKCLEIYGKNLNDKKQLRFLKGLGIILEIEKYQQEKEKLEKLALNFESTSPTTPEAWKLLVEYFLILYSYYHSKQTRQHVFTLIQKFVNSWVNIMNNLNIEAKKEISSMLAPIIMVDEKIKDLNLSTNVNLRKFYSTIFQYADAQSVIRFIVDYEMEKFYKEKEISEIYNELINKVSSNKNVMNQLYHQVYKHILESEDHDLEWIFELYNFLTILGLSEKVHESVEEILKNNDKSLEKIQLYEDNIKLWEHLFRIKKCDKLVERFKEQLKTKAKNLEGLFTSVDFYSLCANHHVKLEGNLHRYISVGVLEHIEDFDESDMEVLDKFFAIQNESFVEEFLKDFKGYLKPTAYNLDDPEGSLNRTNLIFEKFNPILKNLTQKSHNLLEILKDEDFIKAIKNIDPKLPEHIEEFLDFVNVR